MRGTSSVFLLIACTATASLGCNGPLIATVGYVSSRDGAHPAAGTRDEGGVGLTADPRDGGASRADADTRTGEVVQIEPGSRDDFCKGRGPAVRFVPIGGAASAAPVCRAGLGRRLFSYGACSCGDARLTSYFAIDSFDSRQGAYASGNPPVGGALGLNGSLGMLGEWFSLGGSVIIGGSAPITIPNSGSFGGNLKTNAAIAFNGSVGIGITGDLWANADLGASVQASVKGDLYQTPGHSLDHNVQVTGSVHTTDFAIAAPCACGADAVLDVPAIVAQAQHDNDNAELGVSADALSPGAHDAGVPAPLTCGRVLLGDASIPADSVGTVTQRLALFVNGDLTVGANFATSLGSTGELDIFVSGDLVFAGSAGDAQRPTALRFYVGGSEPIALGPGLVTFAAQLYAPNAPVLMQGSPMSFFGSIFAARLEAQGAFDTVHYDRAVLELGEACAPSPSAPCAQCRQCPAGLTCIDGGCVACRSNADCCEPMVCTSGMCQPLLATAP